MTLTPGTVGATPPDTFNAIPIFNALVPKEGPKMVPFVLNFPTNPAYLIDLTLTMQQQRISVVQSVFIDASAATASVSVAVQGTQLTITLEKGDQGFFPILVPTTGAKFSIASASTNPVTVIFLNVPVPSSIWHTALSALGAVSVSGPLALALSSGVAPILQAQAAGATAWTSSSGTTAAAASTALFPAVAAGSRFFVRIGAPATADMWVNPIGGAAGIGLADCFKIPAGGIYENFPGESVFQAWTYFCATGALPFTALRQEGN